MIVVTIIVFILVLGLLIFVHELGHFVAARLVGVKVEEFGMGFPPRIFAITRGETKYS
ncbi:MAG: site-2 protease family protein, partial [Dehalococcoidia bacterium]